MKKALLLAAALAHALSLAGLLGIFLMLAATVVLSGTQAGAPVYDPRVIAVTLAVFVWGAISLVILALTTEELLVAYRLLWPFGSQLRPWRQRLQMVALGFFSRRGYLSHLSEEELAAIRYSSC